MNETRARLESIAKYILSQRPEQYAKRKFAPGQMAFNFDSPQPQVSLPSKTPQSGKTWIPQQTQSGNPAWKNTATGEVRYQEEMPGTRAESTPEPAQAERKPEQGGTGPTAPESEPATGRGDRINQAREHLKQVVNNPDIVGKQRADMIANGRQLIHFLESTPGELETDYHKGDEIAYTGVTDGDFREFIYLEGAKAGAYGQTLSKAAKQAQAEQKQTEHQSQQEQFRNLREAIPGGKAAGQEETPKEEKDAIRQAHRRGFWHGPERHSLKHLHDFAKNLYVNYYAEVE